MKKYIAAAAFIAASITGAKAADVVVQEPVAAYNWSGLYVGAQAGYAWGKSTYVEPDYSTPYNMFYDPKGGFAGAYVGYNWQFDNNVVVGGEADFYGGNIRGRSDYYTDLVPRDDIWGEAKLRWAGAVRARIGYAADRFMPYIAGGVAFGDFKYSATEVWNGRTYGFDASKTFTGWTIGGGLEYAFTDKLIGRLEYRYSDFGKKTINGDDTNDWYTNRVNLRTNDVRIGIAYKF